MRKTYQLFACEKKISPEYTDIEVVEKGKARFNESGWEAWPWLNVADGVFAGGI